MKKMKDLEKIKKKRCELESRLAQLLYKFHQETGHIVTNIYLSNKSSEYSGDFIPTHLSVELDEIKADGLSYYQLFPGFQGHENLFKNKQIEIGDST